jgi:peptidoglycan-associated lipoprotein
MHRLFTIATIAGAVALAGCAKKAPIDVAQPASVSGSQGSSSTGSGQATTGAVGANVPGSNADFVNQMRGRNVILFDTDKYDIDSTDAAALRQQAQWLQQYPNKRATIEGHCDERGTRDYNLALGERRANAAKNYLVSLGIDAARLATISYGKERPVALGSNEQAWAQNRRAVTVTID